MPPKGLHRGFLHNPYTFFPDDLVILSLLSQRGNSSLKKRFRRNKKKKLEGAYDSREQKKRIGGSPLMDKFLNFSCVWRRTS
jgi:hypothetical protein